MNKTTKIVITLLGVGLVAGLLSLYYIFNKPHRNIKLETPTYIVSDQELLNDFNTDEMRAVEKYVCQVVQVSGTIVEVFKDDDQISIVLNNKEKGVNCELDKTPDGLNESLAGALQIGKRVTLKGKCDGLDVIMGVVLTRCYIIE